MLPTSAFEMLLQAGPPAGPAAPQGAPPDFFSSGLGQLLVPILGMFAIFYFLVWRPEGKKRKLRELMIANVKKGDSVVTTGGMLGKVWRVDGNKVTIVIDKDSDVKVQFLKSSIFEVLPPEGAEAKTGTDAKQKAAIEAPAAPAGGS